jgi:hypothetical protein
MKIKEEKYEDKRGEMWNRGEQYALNIWLHRKVNINNAKITYIMS